VLKIGRLQRGFTLIELVIGVAIMALLLALAAPAFSTYSENAKLRGISGSFLASAQTARAEAIRSNQSVQMLLTSDSPVAANAATTNLNATAGSWIIRAMSNDPTPIFRFVDGKSVREASSSASGTSSVQLSAVSNGAATPLITFNGVGSTSLGATWLVDFTSSKGACAPSGPIRCLRVEVTVSGQIKACDPAAAGAGDTRIC